MSNAQPNQKTLKCAGGCEQELAVAHNVESWRCYECIQADRPEGYHRRHHYDGVPTNDHQLELGEVAS